MFAEGTNEDGLLKKALSILNKKKESPIVVKDGIFTISSDLNFYNLEEDEDFRNLVESVLSN